MGKVRTWVKTDFFQKAKGELIGGITVAFVALPLALSFGVLSGLGAEAGIYGAIFTGILVGIFGGTKGQISGPTGAMTVVLVELFRHNGLEGLIAAMILAGILQILMGLFKLGKYIKLIPRPTIIGFTNGIGILIFLKQVEYVKVDPILAMLTLAMVLLLPMLSKKIPAAIIALVIGSVAATFWLPTNLVVGEISASLPRLQIPNFFMLDPTAVVKAALLLALLGAIESLLASLVVDEMTNTKHNSNRELIGQGIANFIAAIFGNLIGTGAIVRSAVNINAGGRGRASAIIHAIILLLLVVKLGSLSAKIPLAVLAGILMGTAIKMVEFKESYRMSSVSKEAFSVIAVTTTLTVAADLMVAVAVGTFLTGILMLCRMGKSYVNEYHIDCMGHLTTIKSFTVEGPLFFGVTEHIEETMIKKSRGADIVIVNLMNAPVIDASGVMTLGRVKDALKARDTRLLLTGLKQETYEKLRRLEVLDGSEEAINLGRIGDALAHVERQRCPQPAFR